MTKNTLISRRLFTTGGISLLGLSLAGCSTATDKSLNSLDDSISQSAKSIVKMYGPLLNEKFPIPAAHIEQVKSQFYRQLVKYKTKERVGTVIVDTKNYYAYLVQENGYAMRYGVGLGRAGFEWSGRANIAWKRKWPTWTPPSEMIKRQPELEKYSAKNGGMQPGLANPLGARALYIFKNGKDTLYRLHGTSEAFSIGKSVSSGCVRFLNHDIIDLYSRVPSGASIIVI